MAAQGQGGTSVSSAQLRQLAREAADDPAALERLRHVTQVDGRAVDLDTALRGDAQALRLRARTIARSPIGDGGAVDPEGARQQALAITKSARFHERSSPRPLAGVLRAIGDTSAKVFRPVGRALMAVLRPIWRLLTRLLRPLSPLARPLKAVFGDQWPLALLAIVVIVASAVVSLVVTRRRTSAGVSRQPSNGRRPRMSAEDLDRDAAAAEQRGDLEAALRLRFEAGVVRLGERGALTYRQSLTTGELVRRVPSQTLRALAATHDEVTYGGRTASSGDLEAARTGWPRVLREVTG